MGIKSKIFGKGRSISPKKKKLNHDQVLQAIQGKKDFSQKGSLNFRLLAFAGTYISYICSNEGRS